MALVNGDLVTPTWLTNDFLQRILRKSEGNPSLSVIESSTKDVAGKGDHYASAMYKVAVDIKSDTNEEKVSPSKFKKFGADCIYFEEKKPFMLILEDICLKGFRLAERRKGLDLSHSVLVLKTLARFHAVSIALHEKEPNFIESFKENGFFEESIATEMDKMISSSINAIANKVESWPDCGPRYAEKLRKCLLNFRQRLLGVMKPKNNPFNVLIHGDLWLNNMMFKYDDVSGTVEDVMFVDYQLCCFTSFALDLQYFIHTSPMDVVRKENTEELLKTYYDELCDTLVCLGSGHKRITFQELQDEYERKAFYGFFSLVTVLPIVMSDPDDAMDMDKLLQTGDDVEGNMKQPNSFQSVQMDIAQVCGGGEPINHDLFSLKNVWCALTILEPYSVCRGLKNIEKSLPEWNNARSGVDFILCVEVEVMETFQKKPPRIHSAIILSPDLPVTIKTDRVILAFSPRAHLLHYQPNHFKMASLSGYVNPEWLDEKFVERALREGETDPDIVVKHIQAKAATAVGDNYASLMYRVSVEFVRWGGKIEKQSLIVKALPQSESMKNLITGCELFLIESNMFKKTLPDMEKLLKEADKEKYKPFSARGIYFAPQSEETLVLEDLSVSGFKVAERQKGLDLEHSMLAIQRLAMFHAASVVLAEKDPMSMAPYYADFITKSKEVAERQKGLDLEHSMLAIQRLAMFHATSVVLAEKDPMSMSPYYVDFITKSKEMEQFYSKTILSFAEEVKTWPEYSEKYAQKLIKLSKTLYSVIFEKRKRLEAISVLPLVLSDPGSSNNIEDILGDKNSAYCLTTRSVCTLTRCIDVVEAEYARIGKYEKNSATYVNSPGRQTTLSTRLHDPAHVQASRVVISKLELHDHQEVRHDIAGYLKTKTTNSTKQNRYLQPQRGLASVVVLGCIVKLYDVTNHNLTMSTMDAIAKQYYRDQSSAPPPPFRFIAKCLPTEYHLYNSNR
uniref:CHK kinase-like domain-containing protein n=1 Tax=Timema tahoe TaxID=61484 RepID=A0A7R9FKR8_9NEOP|nr:unnamed protein product [Timema tahoe]